ncbi:MAG: hypothetical protein JNK82_15545 [Myxococcaceae bacterium]|nr:hypothetical protein [Myxococcaceae bacterium]
MNQLRVFFVLAVAFAVATPALAAGRAKMIVLETKTVPKNVKTLSEQLPKQKDAAKRSAMALVLDDLLRAMPEVTDPMLYDQLAHNLFTDITARMAEPTEVFSSSSAPDSFAPRLDFFFREQVKVKPGRVPKTFSRRYSVKLQGKNVDRVYKIQQTKIDFVAAATDDEFNAWTDAKGWGVVVHSAHVDTTTGVARIACTFVSNGSPEAPGGRFVRPSWVGFYKQGKPGLGGFYTMGLEQVTSNDWREQPINIVPPKAEPNDLTRKLAMAVWMEQVAGIAPRLKLLPQEEALFELDPEGPNALDAAQPAFIEAYRDAESPMVRAAVELKLATNGGQWSPDAVFLLTKQVRHPVVRARLEEQLKKAPAGWKAPPLPPNFETVPVWSPPPPPAPDAGTKLPADARVRDGGR